MVKLRNGGIDFFLSQLICCLLAAIVCINFSLPAFCFHPDSRQQIIQECIQACVLSIFWYSAF